MVLQRSASIRKWRIVLISAAVGLTPLAAHAQVAPTETGDAPVGEVGQRLSRSDLAESGIASPMARIDNRIRNRVQSRIRNRIDRNYDPLANATSPFRVASEEAENTRRIGR
ncbi:hypothetical protein [Stakelama saccharophila]|uniref:Uncharacterized protein n=1 Tax=Stakelama saccharophila TaxID=3075605 RepID=A0ABZ0B910_9SPHN|nr:hypothetical protein [Stakelama sp. W311]WNO53775.1 hypothetical protein RPR59_00470 [Stakelama sp. W311]